MTEPRIYGSRWDKARRAFLARHPLCVMCQQQGKTVAATVVDHITPHKLKAALQSGNKAAIAKAQTLFWDKENWQGLCVSHHSSTKQRMEKGDKGYGCDESGIPLEPGSHWFTSVKSYRLMNALFGLFLMMSLASCESTRTEYIMSPVVPISAELLQDCPAPEIAHQMTYGQSVALNEELLTVIEKCNADKRSIRQIEAKRQERK